MTIDPSALGYASEPRRVTWTAKDCMLYALGVGAGVDELAYTTDNSVGVTQQMLPTMPVTLGVDERILERLGQIDWAMLLHGAQEIETFGPLPVEGSADVTTRIAEIWDKGNAAVIVNETEGVGLDGSPLWRIRATLFLRGAGGWGGERGPSGTTPDTSGEPERTVTYQTAANQALLYRLNGDYNPLHSDPVVAERAGLGKPILHGLCTFGFAGRAVLEATGRDAADLRSLTARFAAPVWPGDELQVQLWGVDSATPRFQVRRSGGEVVLTGGTARLDETR